MAWIKGVWRWCESIENLSQGTFFDKTYNVQFTSNGQSFTQIRLTNSFINACTDIYYNNINIQWANGHYDDEGNYSHEVVFQEAYRFMNFGGLEQWIDDELFEFIQRNATPVTLKGVWKWNNFLSNNKSTSDYYSLSFWSNGAKYDQIQVMSALAWYVNGGNTTSIQGFGAEGMYWDDPDFQIISILGEQSVSEETYRFITSNATCIDTNVIKFPKTDKTYLVQGQVLADCRDALNELGISTLYPLSELPNMIYDVHQKVKDEGCSLDDYIDVWYDIVSSRFQGIAFGNITARKIEVAYGCVYIHDNGDHSPTYTFYIQIDSGASVTLSYDEILADLEEDFPDGSAQYLRVFPTGVRYV